MGKMKLYLRDIPVLEINENGICNILDFDRLPFALRKKDMTYPEFVEWASNRTLSIGRSFAKEILNSLRLSQVNRYAVCKACRGLSLEDAYWIRQDGDERAWKEVSLFDNPLSLYITEVSLSGRAVSYKIAMDERKNIHTPELTTLGASAKAWIRGEDGLSLHKVGRYEIPAAKILKQRGFRHIPYSFSKEEEIGIFLSKERKEWLQASGEKIVNSKLFTSENISLVTFEEFCLFCGFYNLNPYEEAKRIDQESYLQMQIADYILNNNDRHDQNWGFLMENDSGKIIGAAPLFDHDHAFSGYENIMSQTVEMDATLYEAAVEAQRELNVDLNGVEQMQCPEILTQEQWGLVQKRIQRLKRGRTDGN